MKKKKRMLEQYKTWIWSVVAIIVMLIIGALCSGCETVRYITVPEVHEEHHWHTDSIIKNDSVIRETQTTIQQLDSAAMAQYGIKLENAERAWLVKTKELERIVQELMAKSEQKDSVHDTIPIPYPVEVEVPAKLTWIQQAKQHLANMTLTFIVLWILFFLVRTYIFRR